MSTRSRTWLIALVAILTLVATACGGDGGDTAQESPPDGGDQTTETGAPTEGDEQALVEAAEEEGTVVMYISSPLESTEAFTAEFEAAYDIDVQLERIVGLAQYERFKQEEDAGQHTADVIQISDKPAVEDLADTGYLASYTSPNDDAFSEGTFKIPGYAYVPWRTTVAVGYNTNTVSEEDAAKLESWDGILDPRFADGRISMRATQVGAGYAPFLYWLTEGQDEYGQQFLEDLRAQEPTVYPDPVQAAQAVISGQQDVWFTGWESFLVVQHEQGAPIRWVFPSPTPGYGNVWTGISAEAQHPNAAELLMNWLTSEDGALAIQNNYKARASMEGVEDTRTMAEEDWYQAPEELWIPDMEVWAENQERINEAWVETFGDIGAE